MALVALLLACDTSTVQTTGKVSSFDVRCGDDLWTAMGHVDQRTALNVSWPTALSTVQMHGCGCPTS